MARRKKKSDDTHPETGQPSPEEIEISDADIAADTDEPTHPDESEMNVDGTEENPEEEPAPEATEEETAENETEEEDPAEPADKAENCVDGEEEEPKEEGEEEGEDGEEETEEFPESSLPMTSIVEAVLFAAREPLKLVQLARAVGKRTRQDAVREAIAELNVQYLETGRAFEIAEVSGRYQLMSRPEYSEHIMRIYPKKELTAEKDKTQRLTPAMLDTLAIIAYKQPVMRSEIEHIRGVSCSNALRALIERGSVKEMGRRTDLVGKPAVFGTTDRFLIEFGLGSLEELPMRNDFVDPGSPPPVELSVLENAAGETEEADEESGAEPGEKIAENESETVDLKIISETNDDSEDNEDDIEIESELLDEDAEEDHSEVEDPEEEDEDEDDDDDGDEDEEDDEDNFEIEETEEVIEIDAEEAPEADNETGNARRDEANLPF